VEYDDALKTQIYRTEAELKAGRTTAKDACCKLFDFLVERRLTEELPATEKDCERLLESDLSQSTYDVANERGWLRPVPQGITIRGRFKDLDTTGYRVTDRAVTPRLPKMGEVQRAWSHRISEWKARYIELRSVANNVKATRVCIDSKDTPEAKLVALHEDNVELHSAPLPPNIFRQNGAFWTLSFGGKTVYVRHSKGLLYIQELLRAPGQLINAEVLATATEGEIGRPIVLGTAGEIMDNKAITEYKCALTKIESDIREAERNGNSRQRKALEEERQLIDQQLSSSTGLGGRMRCTHKDSEKFRKSVSNAISRAINAVRLHHKQLADHLHRCIDRGNQLRYTETDQSWHF
jgi:hypothetical protein